MTPVVSVRYGDWVFHKGTGEVSWSAREFDDSTWQHVKGGVDWRIHSNYTPRKTLRLVSPTFLSRGLAD